MPAVECDEMTFTSGELNIGSENGTGILAKEKFEVKGGRPSINGKIYGVETKNLIIDSPVYIGGGTKAVNCLDKIELSPEYKLVAETGEDETLYAVKVSDDGTSFLAADGTDAKKVETRPKYSLSINENSITSKNYDKITFFETGTASYDVDKLTLTVDGVKDTGATGEVWHVIYSDDDLTINGDFSIDNAKAHCGIYCSGKLTITGNAYISADIALRVGGLKIPEGYEILIPENGKFDEENQTVVDKDGNPAKIVKIGVKEKTTPTPDPSVTSNPSVTPDPTVTPDPVSVEEPKTEEIKPGTAKKKVDKVITEMKSDESPEGSDYATLQTKASKVTKNSVTLKWNKVKNAASYTIYGNKCGVVTCFKKLKEIKKTSITHKKLKSGTYYKYIVVAFDKQGKALAVSKSLHVATAGGKYSNAKSITTNAKKNKVTLKAKKTFTLKANEVLADKKLKSKKHRAVQFESTNKNVATVTAKGVIKAKKKGTCFVYAYAQNGVMKKIKVTVK